LRVHFLADANFNQKIVRGLLIREPAIDFERPETVIPEKTPDPQVLALAESLGRVLVTHDVSTMPGWFRQFVEERRCAGLILVPDKLPIRDVIEDLLLIWHLTEAGEWVNHMQRLPL
jgi:hypothetical protein